MLKECIKMRGTGYFYPLLTFNIDYQNNYSTGNGTRDMS